MNYIYFVSYTHGIGSGNAEVYLNQEITSIKHTMDVAKYLSEHHSYQGVVVMNYILLRTEP
jgi:hypothetical protein